MRWWLPPIAVTVSTAFDLLALSVPCVTYEMQKSRIAPPPSSLRSPMQCVWCGGSLGPCAAAGTATSTAARQKTGILMLFSPCLSKPHPTLVVLDSPTVTTPSTVDSLASFRLDDRLIVVTGASEGIGRAFAECFARCGAHLVLASRRKEQLEEVRRGIAAAGGRAEVVVTDVTRLSDIDKLASAVGSLAQDRKLVLVNNAGFGFTKPALEVTEDEWDRLHDTHVKGTFFCSQKIGALM